MSQGVARGQCLCGAVAFSVPLPVKWVAHCHCSRCQRAHGAAFVTWVGVRSDDVSIQDLSGYLRWFSASAGGDRGFCGSCGSSMFFRSTQWPDELHIARALFTDSVNHAPQLHAYYDTHVDWAPVADGLPTRPDPKSNPDSQSP